MKQSPQAAARRYARALLDVALATKADPAQLRLELEQASGLVGSNAALRAALLHPGLGAERRARLVAAVFGSGSALLLRLLALLAEKDRIALLPFVATAFTQAWNQQRGVVSAEVVSAVALDDAQRKALAAALEKASGRRVELSARTDERLLGGLVVSMSGSTFDGSVRAQLQGLRRRLAQGEAA